MLDIPPSRHLILLFVFMFAISADSGLVVAQPQDQQRQPNQEIAESPTPSPSPSVQPTIEEPPPAGHQADRGQNITIVDERSPWPAWIANGISALVLVFLAFQTIVNRGMLRSMKKTEGFLESQCTALTRQTNTLEESYRVNSRAYVFISEATLKSAISSGDYPEPKVVVANSGKTPAYRYRIRYEQDFLTGEDDQKARNGIMPTMRPLGEQGHALGPGEFSTIHGPEPKKTWKNPEEREMAMRGLATLHIRGLICYMDVFNENRAYKFSLYARNQTVTHLSWGRFGNDAEQTNCGAGEGSN